MEGSYQNPPQQMVASASGPYSTTQQPQALAGQQQMSEQPQLVAGAPQMQQPPGQPQQRDQTPQAAGAPQIQQPSGQPQHPEQSAPQMQQPPGAAPEVLPQQDLPFQSEGVGADTGENEVSDESGGGSWLIVSVLGGVGVLAVLVSLIMVQLGPTAAPPLPSILIAVGGVLGIGSSASAILLHTRSSDMSKIVPATLAILGGLVAGVGAGMGLGELSASAYPAFGATLFLIVGGILSFLAKEGTEEVSDDTSKIDLGGELEGQPEDMPQQLPGQAPMEQTPGQMQQPPDQSQQLPPGQMQQPPDQSPQLPPVQPPTGQPPGQMQQLPPGQAPAQQQPGQMQQLPPG